MVVKAIEMETNLW